MSHFTYGVDFSNNVVSDTVVEKFEIEITEAVKSILEAYVDDRYKKILVFGYVQSGKTRNMISVVTELIKRDLIDYVIVLTGTTSNLNDQNYDRFNEKLGEIADVINFTKTGIPENQIPGRSIIVSLKNPKKIDKLISFTSNSINKGQRVLIIDDESDHASLDNNNSSNKKSSKTHLKLIELLKSCNSKLLSYTATPQGMLLGGDDNRLKPDKIILLDPYSGYFGVRELINNTNCFQEIQETPREFNANGELTDDLKRAIKYFIETSSKISQLNDKQYYNMLINNTSLTLGHNNLKKDIETFLSLNGHGSVSVVEVNGRKTEDSVSVEDQLKLETHKIIIGGVMLSRGITINNLLVFFTANISKENKHDTVYQRMRFCGDRDLYKEYIRIYSTREMLNFYHDINTNTEMIRDAVMNDTNVNDNKIWYISKTNSENSKLIPTRKGVMSGVISENIIGGSNNIIIDPYNSVHNYNRTKKKIYDFFSDYSHVKIGSKSNYILYEINQANINEIFRNIIFSNEKIPQIVEKYIKIYKHYISSNDRESDSIFVATNFHISGQSVFRTLKNDKTLTYFGDSEREILDHVINTKPNDTDLLIYITDIKLAKKESHNENLLINFCFIGDLEVNCYELP